MGSIIGIDLGTTFSAVATIDSTGRPAIVHNSEGQNITPSCVHFDEGSKAIVGEEARKLLWQNESAVGRFKREMGTSKTYRISGQVFTPTDLSALVLRKLKQDAEQSIGPVGKAVVTIPANFSHEARDATMAAAKSAGLDIQYIINEPTAAALYYAFKDGHDLHGDYAVYDLGGGTFDVSIIRVDGKEIEVLATNGVQKLGGDDFDLALQRLVQNKHLKQARSPLADGEYTKNLAEEDKKSLSKRDKIRVSIVSTRQLIEINRAEFEEAISSLVAQAEMLCEATLEEAGIAPDELRGVFLVGGSTRVPMIVASVSRVFGQKPISTVNVDEVVALGAALYAAFKGDRANLNAAQRIAISRLSVTERTSKCFGTLAVHNNTNRDMREMRNVVLIKKGEQIPCSVTESFFTVSEGQVAVDCEVTESTSPETDPRFVKKIWAGSLELPAGRPAGQEIHVTFSYNENQIMQCSFVDASTGRKTNVDLSLVSTENTAHTIDQFLVE